MAVQKTPPTGQNISSDATRVRQQPATPARDTGSGSASTTPPASGFESGTPGLGGKFSSNPVLRTGRFASRGSGVERTTLALGFETTVGGAIERLGEHLENPENPTGRDLALLNGAFGNIA